MDLDGCFLFPALVVPVVIGVSELLIILLNLLASLLEFIIGIAFSDFSLGRLKRRERGLEAAMPGIVVLLVLLAIFGWFFISPMIFEKQITLVDAENKPLLLVAVRINEGEEDRTVLTNSSGSFKIKRFSIEQITLSDVRYKEQVWIGDEIDSELKVEERSKLGKGLDFVGGLIKYDENK